jgi:alpha-2-macroglobulin
MRRLLAVLVIPSLGLLLSGSASRGAEPGPDTGESAFARKDFKKALGLFRAELEAAADPLKERRVVACLAALGEWGEALRTGEALVSQAGDSLEGVRARRLLADVYLRAEHRAFKLGDEIRRGGENREGEEVWLQQEDQAAALQHLEAAREVLYLIEDGRLPASSSGGDVLVEVLATDLDLADLLQSRWGLGPMPRARVVRVSDRYFAPRNEWAAFLRSEGLLREVVQRAGNDARSAALATYASALQRHRVRNNVARLKQADRPLTKDEQDALALIGDPAADLRALGRRYPGDPLADDAAFAAARVLEETSDTRGAEAAYEDVLVRYPKSLWASDARGALQDLRRKEVSFQIPGPVLPGREASLTLSCRNVTRVVFSATRLDPEAAFLQGSRLTPATASFRDAPVAPGPEPAADVVASWEQRTGDDGNRRVLSAQVPLPHLRRGLYRLEARAEGVAYAAYLLVSDLALVQEAGSDQALLYAVDAITGAPVEGASVLAREREPWNEKAVASLYRGRTGSDGTFVLTLASTAQNRALDAVAWVGDRLAATPDAYVYRWNQAAPTRIHVSTDRPVYRPGHSVHFRAQVLRGEEAGDAPASQASVSIVVRDPKGSELYRHSHVTDAFGVVSGSLELGAEAPLGEYAFTLDVGGEGRVELAGGQFRVEEYRKPDFQVVVEAGEALRAGAPGRATLVARYYFGSPVADAAVTWRVFWRPGLAYWPFHDADAWLFGEGSLRSFRAPARQLVSEGRARTDAAGRMSLEFATRSGEDGRYEIEAQVVDLSRREVRGSGIVRASRAAFALFVRPDRGFYRPGETATFEVAAADPNGRPVSTEASAVVYRRTWSALHETVAEAAVLERTVQVGATGRTSLQFAPETGGEYRLAVRAVDARQEAVSAETLFDVADDGTASELFRLSDVELRLERMQYAEGETAQLLVSSSRRGSVLLTEEAGGRILGHRSVALDGRRRVVPLKLTRAHAPNVFLHATLVSQGQVYQARQEVLVPPTPRFLSVEAKPRSAIVKPGAEETVDVLVRDAAGRPVAASLLLAVTDRSVEAIQAPYAPDIRSFFYGARRQAQLQETSSFAFCSAGSTWRLVPDVALRRHGLPPGWWGDFRRQRSDWAGDELDLEEGVAGGIEGGVAGGVLGGVASQALPSSLPAARKAASLEARDEMKVVESSGVDEGLVAAQTRSVFADTAFWSAAVLTDATGRASVRVRFPDSLTDWKIVARGGDRQARVGEATAGVVARKDLTVRLQSPRFFVERDRVLLSALIQNDTAEALDVRAAIEVSDVLQLDAAGASKVRVEKNGQARVEWPAHVVGAGTATIRVSALTRVESDAAELRFEALVHGVDKQVSQTGRLRAGESRELVFDVPADRGPGSARLMLSVAPSLLSSLIEAVPYLVDYPYGCVEQTMSRFLPSVVLARTLQESGLRLEDLAARRRLITKERSYRHDKDPVFDAAELEAMVRAGLARLYAFQGDDGGWGWWRADASDIRISAYVVYGLATARAAGFAVDDKVLDRGVAFLAANAREATSLHERAYAAFALASAGRSPEGLDTLFARREDLTVHGKSLLALALQRSGRVREARVLVSNLEDLAQVDEASDTASWRVASRWWFWENDRVETQAFALWALAEIAPDHPLAPRVARWLLLNRQGSRWDSTRDTAHAIYALAAFAKGAGETGADLTAEVQASGITKAFRITPQNAYAFDDTLVLGDAELGSGRRTVSIKVTGTGFVYYAATLRYFTKEEDIAGAGTDLRLSREYYRRTPRVVVVEGERRLEYDYTRLSSLSALKSGDEVEARLAIEAPSAYDHLVFEDPKPAGFEPVDLVSGSRYGDGLCSNMELRDARVAFFITHLAQGRQVIRYVLRAETPGEYHALPARGYAMYAPGIAALANEWRVRVEP